MPSPTSPSSKDSPDKCLNIVTSHWDLTAAVAFIQSLQLRAHAAGWNLCLGGGVLNNGFSYGDLDIVAVPRDISPTPRELPLLQLFPNPMGDALVLNNPRRFVHRRRPIDGRPPVDLIIIIQP